MATQKQKLLVSGAGWPGAVDAAALRALAAVFDVEVVDAARAADAVRRGESAMVLAPAPELRTLERTVFSSQESVLLEAIGEAACLCDTSGRVLWSNRAFQTLEPSARDRALDACRRAGEALLGQPSAGPDRVAAHRHEVITSDGRYYEAVLSHIAAPPGSVEGATEGPDGRAWLVAAALRDVTVAHRTEQKIDALDRAGAELVRIEADTVRRMRPHDRLEFLRKKIVQLAHDLLQWDNFVIYLMQKDGRKLEAVMQSGLRAGVQDIALYAAREGNGISGYVAATGRSYICPDATKDPRYIRGMDTPGSSLTVPLNLNDKVIGVFNVESNRVGSFTEDDRHFAELFARYIAMALHMLDMLVVERASTNEALAGRMEGVLQEPLNDLVVEADWLREQTLGADPVVRQHIERIVRDVDAIRRRVREVASGPRSILGVDRELDSAQEDPLLSGRRALVADDDQEIRDLIASVLRNRGAVVTVCANGAEAIAELERAYAVRSHAGSGDRSRGDDARYRLVVSDIRMPDANGYEVFSAARRMDEALPVILMTGFGYDPHHSIVRASQEGLQCVLFKPFQVERLIEEVHKALAGPAPAG